MNPDHEKIILRVFPEVLEKMAFMFAEPAGKSDLFDWDGHFVKAEMSFSGPLQGSLELIVPVDLCPLLAENILGDSQQDAPEKAYDALKEVLNVTCGNLLTEIAGQEPVFDLTVPQVVELEAFNSHEASARADHAVFTVDDLPVYFGFKVT